MEAKVATVREREGDWLAQAIKTQQELEGVWHKLEVEEGYRMRPCSLDSEETQAGIDILP